MTRYIPELATADERQDEHAIRALSDRYTDAVNQRDWDAYAGCWTDDAVWALGPPVKQLKEGLPAIMKEVRRAVGAMDLFVQMPHAFTFVELDGDRATARVTLNEVGSVRPESRDLLGGAEGMSILAIYTDELVRGADRRWRYARRNYDVRLFDGHAPRVLRPRSSLSPVQGQRSGNAQWPFAGGTRLLSRVAQLRGQTETN